MSGEKMLSVLRRVTKHAYRVRGLGLGRTCEALRRVVARRWRGPQIQINDFMGDLKFNCDLREHMGSQIFWRGHYSGGQLKLLNKLLCPGQVFVDVGANHGEFTVYAARLVGSVGRVLAIEPVSTVRERLEANIRLNDFRNVTVVPCAMSNAPGLLSIFSASDAYRDGTSHEGLPTLFPSDERSKQLEQVEVRTLDATLVELAMERVDVIKLDIEGGELSALQGAERALQRFRPTLVLEVAEATCRAAGHSPLDLIHWIEQRGYRIERVRHDGTTKRFDSNSELLAFQNVVAIPERP